MVSPEQSSEALVEILNRKQRKHLKLLRKVEKATARLERRKSKLQSLELGIADLERRVTGALVQDGGAAPGSAALKQATLIFNPLAGPDHHDGELRLAHIVTALRHHGIEARIGLKTSGKAARLLAAEAVRSGEDLVIVAGGDGTVEDVAAVLVGSSIALGVVPIGTMNNFARSLGVPAEIDSACALIAMGTRRHVDVGRVLAVDRVNPEYFLESAGFGLSAVVAEAGQALEKKRWAKAFGAVRHLFDLKRGRIRVEIDDTAVEAMSRLVIVANAPLVANNMVVAPEAKMDDGLLEVAIYDDLSYAELLKHFVAAPKKAPEKSRMYRGRRIRITAEEPAQANSDKEVTGDTHVVDIEIVPKALWVMVGNGKGLTVPVEAAPVSPGEAPGRTPAGPPPS